MPSQLSARNSFFKFSEIAAVVIALAAIIFLSHASVAYASASDSRSTEFSVTLQIRESVLKTKSSKMEETLARLPESLRRGFTLAYASQSRLETSAQYPAAILFGDDAKTLVAFHGAKTHKGFAALDILEFDKSTGFYKPARFLFEPTERDLATAEITEKLQGTNVYYEANPKACARCHGAEAHPIFETGYPEWKGFYGSDRDHLYGVQHKTEIAGFKSFQKIQKSNSRYAMLMFPSAKVSSMTPFLDETAEKKAPNGYAYSYRPNLMFGAYLVRNNAVGIASKLKRAPGYLKLRAALAFSLERCDFKLVAKTRAHELKKELSAFSKLSLNSSSFLSNELKLNREFGAQISAALGISAAHWNLALSRNNETAFGYWSGYGDTLDFVHAELVRDIFGSRLESLYDDVEPLGDSSEGGKFYSRRLQKLGVFYKSRGPASCQALAQQF